MSIKTNNVGFTEAELDTANGAELHAQLDSDDSFEVVTNKAHLGGSFGWFFDEPACREAAEFFTRLADELARRADA